MDDLTVQATSPNGIVVNYTATATDAQGRPLTPVCTPPSGSVFPVGQTLVTCTATDQAGNVGRDTALINVGGLSTVAATRIWVASLTFSGVTATVTAQVDLSVHVQKPCQAQVMDRGPAWSPDGGSLVFAGSGVLCVVDPAGRNPRTPVVPPPTRPGTAADPAWSPDGLKIAYAWFEGESPFGRDTVWTVPAGGGAPTPVVDTPGDAFQPAFQPLPPNGLTLTASAAPRPSFVGSAPIQVTFTARNAGRQPARQVWLGVDVPLLAGRQPTSIGTLAPGATFTLTLPVAPTQAVNGTATGKLTGVVGESSPATVGAQAPVEVIQPVLRVDPGVGPPGFVPLVSGTGFPPGATVTVSWSLGISAPTKVTVAADGTFRTQLLVFHHDPIGPRLVTATGTGFGQVTAAFTVVPANQDPAKFVERR